MASKRSPPRVVYIRLNKRAALLLLATMAANLATLAFLTYGACA